MKKLTELSVLAIDCQATHSKPASGCLVEIAWVKTQAAHTFDHNKTTENTESHLVKIKKNIPIPKQFSRITGITPEEMKSAVLKKNVWQRLFRTAKKTSIENWGICPAVIHFGRYETPHLEQMHREFTPQQEFPFKILCTHKIVSRLYPGLPRKSLRASAGFFGYSIPKFRRSLHHAVATAFIWNQVVRVLEEQEKITTYEKLQDWLHNSPDLPLSKSRTREFPMEKSLLKKLPDKPGIYRMCRSQGDLLYIGKAKSLKSRVNSYFHKKGRHSEHILEMLSQARQIATTVTETALEAAILESDEIKRHSPLYNMALQSHERKLFFYSKDLKSKQLNPTTRHPIGPIPSNIKMDSAAKLIDLLNGKIQKFSPRLIEAVLLTPAEYAPDKKNFKLGLEAFKKKYFSDIQTSIHLGHMMSWGTQFWKEKLAEMEKEQQKESEPDKEASQEVEQKTLGEGWTPERVFKALKRVIRIASFQMRRARWLCRLSESSLAWSSADENKKDSHAIVFEKGLANIEVCSLKANCINSPPGHKKSLLDRQINFDVAAYDRMRIVTTEMKRLIQEGRDIELCFHPGNVLSGDRLAKILKWV